MPNRASASTCTRPGSPTRWLIALAAAVLASQLSACADTLPLAPGERQAATTPLPAAAQYIIELGTSGRMAAPVTRAITDAGGRVLRVDEGMGLALVAGLTPQAADGLRSRSGIRLILPNTRRQLVREQLSASHLLRARHASAMVTPLAFPNPRTAQFFSRQWNMSRIRADSAWQVTPQGSGTSVFIIDSGVDTAHIDLVGRVDGSRSTSLAYAPNDTDFTQPLPYGHDVAGHGTFVASLIASNSLGVAAVAPQSRLVMVRVLNDEGSADDFTVISGILYAADHGADVINMSLGGYLSRTSSFDLAIADLLQRAIDYATQRGALVVAAAGNESVYTNTATGPHGSYADSLHTPAGGLLHVLSVGATGPVNQKNFDQIAAYSNYGSADVAVFAPGGNTVNSAQDSDLVLGACSSAAFADCLAEDRYLFGAGSSFSAPLVAGEAAVINSYAQKKPTPAELEACVLNTAFRVHGVRPDTAYGFGRIDVLSGVLSSSCK